MDDDGLLEDEQDLEEDDHPVVKKPGQMKLKSGPDWALEEEADRWLAEARRELNDPEDRDYFTKDQLNLRSSREITNSSGVCDEALVRGLFKRSYNPNFGQRPKKVRKEE